MRRLKYNYIDETKRNRWMVSYADFITLLFVFFVMMYVVSAVNDSTYHKLSAAITQALKPSDNQLPIEKEKEITKPALILDSVSSLPGRQSVTIKKMGDAVKKSLAPWIQKKIINVVESPVRLEIQINASALFSSGSAVLEAEAEPILNTIAGILAEVENAIHIEGFTDNRSINNKIYPSNWELSAARAASVVRTFREQGVRPARMAAIGYGEFRPVADNQTSAGRNRNRRILVVVLPGSDPRDIVEIIPRAISAP